jgi:phage terminase Nu1 subunit (DNA packaging protein)
MKADAINQTAFVSRKRLAEMLHRPREVIARWQKMGMPFSQPEGGKFFLYDPTICTAWIKAQEITEKKPKRPKAVTDPAKRG